MDLTAEFRKALAENPHLSPRQVFTKVRREAGGPDAVTVTQGLLRLLHEEAGPEPIFLRPGSGLGLPGCTVTAP